MITAIQRRSSGFALLTVAGAALLAFGIGSAAAEPVSVLGDEPLQAKLEKLDGSKLKLEALRGEPVFLELWATWCLPCREQAEIVEGLSAELERRGVRVLAVNEGEKPKVVKEFLVDHPSHAEVVLDPYQVVATRLEVAELPALVLLDAEGVVVGFEVGLTQDSTIREMLAVLGDP